ncbi:MAG: acetoacetate--CoA ligase [Rhizobiaceae bacterium]|nr:acetoacetate--CoA ligase [Rhizobiaceae bacterium]
MAEFTRFVEMETNNRFENYNALHQWSVNNIAKFWNCIWKYCDVIGDNCDTIVENGKQMPGARFFPRAKLNFAQNLLRNSGPADAIVFWGEDKVKMRLSWDDLHEQVSCLQQAFIDFGIKSGDRIAAMLPNRPEAIVAMLAASSIGAIWSSCSPDFGERGVLDRFSQIKPKLFIACDGYWYNGKKIDVADKLVSVCEKLGANNNIIVSYLGDASTLTSRIANSATYEDLLASYKPAPVEYAQLPFDHPLYILFSSGTTGIPKCIVHCQGGMLLQHLKEHQLHCDIRSGDRVFYFTTCGWMMWNWLASALASGATLMLYDGSPFYPDGNILFDYCEQEKFTLFGTSAKYIDAVRNAGLSPKDSHNLDALRTMTSTGSPLADENFHFVYSNIKTDIHLASMSGGTDIAACFVLGIPTLPVFIGEIQGPALGMASDVWSDEGKPLRDEKGELVCYKPFPSMPIKFWNDENGSQYHKAYFDRFDNVWCHGDYAQWTVNRGMIIHGRSDATLNPGGVRIGTAEIYNLVEQLTQINEAICIGHKWRGGAGDVRVVLFVVTAHGVVLDDELRDKIKRKIRNGASPRHVPSVIISVEDIPRTKSGKITELAVRDVVHGLEVKNKDALANPQALDLFIDLPELQ